MPGNDFGEKQPFFGRHFPVTYLLQDPDEVLKFLMETVLDGSESEPYHYDGGAGKFDHADLHFDGGSLRSERDEEEALMQGLLDLMDPDQCPDRYLPYLAAQVGLRLYTTDSTLSKREQIKGAIHWYKEKCKPVSFTLLFNTMGFTVDLYEMWTDGVVCKPVDGGDGGSGLIQDGILPADYTGDDIVGQRVFHDGTILHNGASDSYSMPYLHDGKHYDCLLSQWYPHSRIQIRIRKIHDTSSAFEFADLVDELNYIKVRLNEVRPVHVLFAGIYFLESATDTFPGSELTVMDHFDAASLAVLQDSVFVQYLHDGTIFHDGATTHGGVDITDDWDVLIQIDPFEDFWADTGLTEDDVFCEVDLPEFANQVPFRVIFHNGELTYGEAAPWFIHGGGLLNDWLQLGFVGAVTIEDDYTEDATDAALDFWVSAAAEDTVPFQVMFHNGTVYHDGTIYHNGGYLADTLSWIQTVQAFIDEYPEDDLEDAFSGSINVLWEYFEYVSHPNDDDGQWWGFPQSFTISTSDAFEFGTMEVPTDDFWSTVTDLYHEFTDNAAAASPWYQVAIDNEYSQGLLGAEPIIITFLEGDEFESQDLGMILDDFTYFQNP